VPRNNKEIIYQVQSESDLMSARVSSFCFAVPYNFSI